MTLLFMCNFAHCLHSVNRHTSEPQGLVPIIASVSPSSKSQRRQLLNLQLVQDLDSAHPSFYLKSCVFCTAYHISKTASNKPH